jgi:hypothetical protein
LIAIVARKLPLVFLHHPGRPQVRVARIATEFLKSAALTQQIPVLVKLDLDPLEPLLIRLTGLAVLIEALLFSHQFPDVIEHQPVGRRDLCGVFVCHGDLSTRHPTSEVNAGSWQQDGTRNAGRNGEAGIAPQR